MFISPSYGRLSFDEVFERVAAFFIEEPDTKYKLIIGTDSQAKDGFVFVTALIIYRVGKGGRFFYRKEHETNIHGLRHRIYTETAKSLKVASKIMDKLIENGFADVDVEIHLDVGEHGETRDIIREIVGMVTGSGFDAKIKPDSYGASKVADKYTK
ncbi:MAG: ribonuclease H-like YkuK family protein [Bacillota bacterium]